VVNENIIPIENKKAQVVEVREIENYQVNWLARKILSTVDCCKNSLCGCSCSSRECKCKNASMWVGDNNYSFMSHSASGRVSKEEIDNPEDLSDWALKVAGEKDRKAGGQISSSMFGYRDSNGELKVLSGTAGGEIGRGGIVGRASADLYNVKSDGVQVRVGVAADTGISVEDGLEVKAVGFGISARSGKVEFSTPIFSVSKDTDNCVIQ